MAYSDNGRVYEEVGLTKHYEWRVKKGDQSKPINNDHVIEAHYCHPAAKGITINTTLGRLYIDFDTLQTDDAGAAAERLSFFLPGETEPVVWYYRGDALWREYGSQDTSGASSSVTSDDIERHFAANRQGSLRFSAGSAGYSLDFSTMTQTNLTTGVARSVRRRPKFKEVGGGVQAASSSSSSLTPTSFSYSSLPSLTPASPFSYSSSSSPVTSSSSLAPSGGVKWEFLGNQEVWTEFEAHACSFDSAGIERRYQQDPNGQLHFKANGFSYTLDFAGMFQTNDFYGTQRAVRRTPLSSWSAALPRWQFRDINGQWKDYNKVGGHCSVSSADIEQQYQQNPSGTMRFTTTSYSYELDFTAMTQTNLNTGKTRRVQRLNQ